MSTKSYQQQYQTVPSAGNPRHNEAWALTEAARRMKVAQSSTDDDASLLSAVRLNWRLWTIFQASLLEPGCPVPLEVRQNVLSLANFVDKTTVNIIAEPKPEKVDILISINRELAAGLFADPQQATGDTAGAGAEAPSISETY